MTPYGAVQLLDIYARAQEALERDEPEQASAILDAAEALISEPAPADADVGVLIALAAQVEAARSASEAALVAATDRLQRKAAQDMRAGGDGARAYAGRDEQPAARFIDRTG